MEGADTAAFVRSNSVHGEQLHAWLKSRQLLNPLVEPISSSKGEVAFPLVEEADPAEVPDAFIGIDIFRILNCFGCLRRRMVDMTGAVIPRAQCDGRRWLRGRPRRNASAALEPRRAAQVASALRRVDRAECAAEGVVFKAA